jgi:hypothetical protein
MFRTENGKAAFLKFPVVTLTQGNRVSARNLLLRLIQHIEHGRTRESDRIKLNSSITA